MTHLQPSTSHGRQRSSGLVQDLEKQRLVAPGRLCQGWPLMLVCGGQLELVMDGKCLMVVDDGEWRLADG